MGALYGIYRIGKSAIEGAAEGAHRGAATLASGIILALGGRIVAPLIVRLEQVVHSHLDRAFGHAQPSGLMEILPNRQVPAQPPVAPAPTPVDSIKGRACAATARVVLDLFSKYPLKLGIANPEAIIAAVQRAAQTRSMSTDELRGIVQICAESGIEISEAALHRLINFYFPNTAPEDAQRMANTLIVLIRQPRAVPAAAADGGGAAPAPAGGVGGAREVPAGINELLQASVSRLSRSVEGSLQHESQRVVAAAGRNVERVMQTTTYALENLIFVLVILAWHHSGI